MPLVVLATEAGLRGSGPAVRASGGAMGGSAVVRLPPRDVADGRAAARCGRRPHLGPGAQGVRGDDRVRRQPRRPDPERCRSLSTRLARSTRGAIVLSLILVVISGRGARDAWRAAHGAPLRAEHGPGGRDRGASRRHDGARDVRRRRPRDPRVSLGPNGAGARRRSSRRCVGLGPRPRMLASCSTTSRCTIAPPERRPIGIAFQRRRAVPASQRARERGLPGAGARRAYARRAHPRDSSCSIGSRRGSIPARSRGRSPAVNASGSRSRAPSPGRPGS